MRDRRKKGFYVTGTVRYKAPYDETAYEKMRRERDDALNQVAEERQKTFMAKKNFREDITKVNKKTNDKVLDMKNRMQFWQIVSIGTLTVGFLIGWIL